VDIYNYLIVALKETEGKMFKKASIVIIFILLAFNALAFSQEKIKGWHVAVELEGGGLIFVNFDHVKWAKVSNNKVIYAKIRFQYPPEDNFALAQGIIDNINIINSSRKPKYPYIFKAGGGETTIYVKTTNWSIKHTEMEIVFDPTNWRYVCLKDEVINTDNQAVQSTRYYDGVLALGENSAWRYMTSDQGLKAVMEYLREYLEKR
jgi:hypothetical protein